VKTFADRVLSLVAGIALVLLAAHVRYDLDPVGFSPTYADHPLLLAVGPIARVEWLVNPLLGAAETLAPFFPGNQAYDEKTSRVAALLGAASPSLPFMSSEHMDHTSALLFPSLSPLFYLRTIRMERRGRAARVRSCPSGSVSRLCTQRTAPHRAGVSVGGPKRGHVHALFFSALPAGSGAGITP